MYRHKFEMELIFDSTQMDIIFDSYLRSKEQGFSGALNEYIETLAQVGICTTLLKIAQEI